MGFAVIIDFSGKSPNQDNLAKVGAWLSATDANQKTVLRVGRGWGAVAGGGASIANIDGLVAVMTGAPEWRDSKSQAYANEHGRAATLIWLWQRSGGNVMKDIGGRFSFVIWDVSTGAGLSAIDRVGQEALCYARFGEQMIISSKLDCIRIAHGNLKMRPQAIYDLLQLSCVPAPKTFFEGVFKLEAGFQLSFNPSDIKVSPYWTLTFKPDPAFSDPRSSNILSVMQNSVEKAAGGIEDASLGAFLSGGLDSSSMVGLLSRLRPTVNSYTIRFHHPRWDEGEWAQIVAKKFQTNHREIYVEAEHVLDSFEVLARAFDEPFFNDSALPTYHCAKAAGVEGRTTLIAGDGGDEIFGGNERYIEFKRIDQFGRVPALIREFMGQEIFAKIPMLKKVHGWQQRYAIPMPDRLYSYGEFFGRSPDVIFSPELSAQVSNEATFSDLRTLLNRFEDYPLVQQLMGFDMQLTLADNDLRKVSRATEAAGVNVVYPMLSDQVIDSASRVPEGDLLPGMKLRHYYKEMVRGFLPDPLLTKPKHGFGLPFEHWSRTDADIKAYVREKMKRLSERGIFSGSYLESVSDALDKDVSNGLEYQSWKLAMFESWLEIHT